MLLRRVDGRRGEWLGAAFLSVVVGGELSAGCWVRMRSRRKSARWYRKHGLTREQIAFRRRLQRQFGVLARQEYPESADDCFLASGSCVFDTEAIDRRLREAPAPVERRWAGALEVWLKPMAGREYLVAVDPAGGGSEGDYAAMQVLDAATGLQCAEFQGRCGLLEIAERAATIGARV